MKGGPSPVSRSFSSLDWEMLLKRAASAVLTYRLSVSLRLLAQRGASCGGMMQVQEKQQYDRQRSPLNCRQLSLEVCPIGRSEYGDSRHHGVACRPSVRREHF